MTKIIYIKDTICLVDDEDYEYLMSFKWHVQKGRHTLYARTFIQTEPGKFKKLLMHRMIMKLNDPKLLIDHKDMNGLNNQKNNLRICSFSQNNANRKKVDGSKSKYLGVTFGRKKWIATIIKDKKNKHLGCFENEKDAAIAYDNAAKVIHGEFANLNFAAEHLSYVIPSPGQQSELILESQ